MFEALWRDFRNISEALPSDLKNLHVKMNSISEAYSRHCPTSITWLSFVDYFHKKAWSQMPDRLLKTNLYFIHQFSIQLWSVYRSSHPEVFLGKGAMKICSKFTGEHSCRNAISIKLLWRECSPVNLLHIFTTPFPMNISGWLLLYMCFQFSCEVFI